MSRERLTEKVNGRREWSVYGLNELNKTNDEMMKIIVLTNALCECGLETIGNRHFRLNSKPQIFLYVKKDGSVLIKSPSYYEEVKDPRTLFDRIRVAWGNLV